MNSVDFQIVDGLHDSFTRFCRQVQQDVTCPTSCVEVKSLLRAFTLLGSGLLAIDSPDSIRIVENVLTELVNNNIAASRFPWDNLTSVHLAACAVHFANKALGKVDGLKLPDVSLVRISVTLLEKLSNVSLPESDTATLVYISRLFRHSTSLSLAQTIERTVSCVFGEDTNCPTPESVIAELWTNGTLFSVSRSRALSAVDSGPDANRDAAFAAVCAAGELASLHAAEAPGHAAALALILCSSVHASHRAAGIRVVRALAICGDPQHLAACVESLRDAFTLPNNQVFLSGLHCLRDVIDCMTNDKTESLATHHVHRTSSLKLAFDALLRLTEQEESGGLAAALSLPICVHVAGDALVTHTQIFVELFSSLFVRAARGSIARGLELETKGWAFQFDEPLVSEYGSALDALVDSFRIAVGVAWARLGAHRKPVIQACISAVLESKKREEVKTAAFEILTLLLQCEGEDRSRRLMEALRDKAARYNSLKNAYELLDGVLVVPASKKVVAVRDDRYGLLTNYYYQKGTG